MRPSESFISQPIRSLQTMLRVIAEDDNSLPTIVPDGIYGISTMQAVTEFQRREGLPLTGITDQATWETIVSRYEPALIRIGQAEPIYVPIDPNQVFILGDTGPQLYLAQSMLIQLALDTDTLTAPEHNGQLDKQTQSALKEFQRMSGLDETGQLDKITWHHLAKHYSASTHKR